MAVSSFVILSQVLGNTEDGATSMAALQVEHDAFDRGLKAEELGTEVICTGHVHAVGGTED